MFGRRSSSPQPEVTDAERADGGKGRATPTRKAAEAARKQRMTPPRSRKEQSARKRDQTRVAREKMRAAMATGDDKYLPVRDQGPVKRYVRDWVDGHRTMGEFLLPVFFVVFLLVVVSPAMQKIGSYLWLVVIALMTLDSARVVRGVKSGIRQKFGEAETKGVTMYAVMRAWQMRRLRLPKPMVKPGDSGGGSSGSSRV